MVLLRLSVYPHSHTICKEGSSVAVYNLLQFLRMALIPTFTVHYWLEAPKSLPNLRACSYLCNLMTTVMRETTIQRSLFNWWIILRYFIPISMTSWFDFSQAVNPTYILPWFGWPTVLMTCLNSPISLSKIRYNMSSLHKSQILWTSTVIQLSGYMKSMERQRHCTQVLWSSSRATLVILWLLLWAIMVVILQRWQG